MWPRPRGRMAFLKPNSCDSTPVVDREAEERGVPVDGRVDVAHDDGQLDDVSQHGCSSTRGSIRTSGSRFVSLGSHVPTVDARSAIGEHSTHALARAGGGAPAPRSRRGPTRGGREIAGCGRSAGRSRCRSTASRSASTRRSRARPSGSATPTRGRSKPTASTASRRSPSSAPRPPCASARRSPTSSRAARPRSRVRRRHRRGRAGPLLPRIGAGSQPIVESWNGGVFERPATRVRETVQFLR